MFYGWARFIPGSFSLPIGLSISDLTALTAAILATGSTALCFWLPKKHTTEAAVAIYLSLVVLVSVLIYTSGGLASPFISTWLAVALFAGFFGGIISAALGLAALSLIISSHLSHALEIPMIITYGIFAIMPLALSFVLWHREPKRKKDNAFRDLANRLSTVEGKSDVVINSIEDGVMSINRSGVIDLINPAAETLLGWTSGDALGLDWRSVFKLVNIEGREITENENPVAEALNTHRQTHSDTLQIVTGSDRKRLASIVSSPVGQSDGGVIVVFRDITKEKAEEREQAEFISTASHEMRTPVASIEGYLGLALNPATAQIDEKARDYIGKAHQSAKHLGELFQNLLDISKAEDGRLNSSPEVIDVIAMMGDIFESLEPLAREKGLRYIYKPNPSLETESVDRRMSPVYYAYVDPSHLREVTSNLIENAIKYTLKGDVIVDVSGDEKIVTISFQDSGIGIPTEDLPHLFQKFYRVDNTDTREIGGTGLGLYLCRRLAESMDGGLRVESKYQAGSTFFLDIPRMSHEDAMAKLSEMPEEPAVIPITSQTLIEPTAAADSQETQAYNTSSAAFAAMPTTVNVPESTPVAQTNYIQPPAQPVDSSALKFKIPTEFENLPFQEMTLADIEVAVSRQPVYENSGLQPLNILPDPIVPSEPSTMPNTHMPLAAPTQSTSMPTGPANITPTVAPYANRQTPVDVPQRPLQ